ncbi:MAG: 30S ribosomal protein S15 [Gloeobacterales cyanobacterium]
MPLTQEKKQELIEGFKTHSTDTGSPEVQVAMLTERINQLTQHLRSNPKDFASRRGLLKIISQRKQLLGYVAKMDTSRYQKIVERLGLRR